ncbi:MAG: EAL domain-containing protein [Chromatiales bacterium]|nr:EAL domain-containing protein [Chromatiales bacterium]
MQGKVSAATDRWSELTEDELLHLQEVIDACDVGLCLVDRNKRALMWNPWLTEYLGNQHQFDQQSPIEALIPALAGPRFDSMVHLAIAQSQKKGLQASKKQTQMSRHLFSLEKGQFLRVSVRPMMMHPGFCLVQINELAAEQKPGKSSGLGGLTENRTKAILSSVEDAVILVNEQGMVEFVNLAAESMTGFQSQRISGCPLAEIYQVYDEMAQSAPLLSLEQILADDSRQLVLIHREGLTIPIQQTITRLKGDDGQPEGFVLVFKDTSQSRKLAAQLNWQSSHDPITRLYNRAEFDRRLSLLLDETQFEEEQHCLLYLDIDRFLIVNDNCGYAAGDELLRQLASLIKRSIRNSDLIARLGGDEFGILLSQCTLEVAERIAETIRQEVQDFRFAWEGKTFSQSLSIGMVPIDRRSGSVEQILGLADIACITAKEEGRNKVHVYDSVDSSAARRHGETQWVTRIRTALEEDRFTLYVQPISSLNGEDQVQEHVEVLIRLHDEDENLIPPGAFIPAAERFGLMPAVDHWVVDQVARFITRNRDSCLAAGRRFFVNLSGHSVCDDEFLQWILLTIREREIPVGMLCFEVTETAAISNLTSAEHFMRTLQRYGCEFALDDFGSGLSSFGYLKHLPVEYLKIDGAFVHDMLDNAIDESMVEAINRIGHIMGLETIAEFVETEEILQQLKSIGVDFVQGYGVCRPFPIKRLLDEC